MKKCIICKREAQDDNEICITCRLMAAEKEYKEAKTVAICEILLILVLLVILVLFAGHKVLIMMLTFMGLPISIGLYLFAVL